MSPDIGSPVWGTGRPDFFPGRIQASESLISVLPQRAAPPAAPPSFACTHASHSFDPLRTFRHRVHCGLMRRATVLACGALLCGSCGEGAAEPSQSLVGAQSPPSQDDLVREAFYIVRRGGPNGGHSLTYDWRRDGELIVEHAFSDGVGRSEARGREALRIPADAAAQARRLLARLHPARLEGVEQDARPLGCGRQGPHDVGEFTIGFIRASDEPGIQDDEVGLFALPYPSSCDTPAAREARKVVQGILQLLPRSSVAAEFERSG